MKAANSDPVRRSKGRSLQLDFLRGIAILLVLAVHFRLEFAENTPVLGWLVQIPMRIGWVGVDLFFVLSGFLVGGLLITEYEKYGKIDAKRFLIRRGFKIYPLYYLFFGYLFLMPMAKAVFGGGDPAATFLDLWQKYWPNLLFLNGYLGDNPISHTWTLAIEEHFYLILPFFLIVAFKYLTLGQISWICALILIPVTLFRSWQVLDPDIGLIVPEIGQLRVKETHFRIDSLFVGVAVRGFASSAPGAFARLGTHRLLLVTLGALSLSVVPYLDLKMQNTGGFVLTSLGAAALLIGTIHLRKNDIPFFQPLAFKMVKVVGWIGVYSYSIYLWHITLIAILERTIVNLGYSADMQFGMLIWLMSGALIFTITILVGAALSKAVEIPALRVRDRFYPSKSGFPSPSPNFIGPKL